ELFAADPSRADRFSIEAGELVLDYSKHWVDAETMRLLAGLAAQAQLAVWIARMFAGDPINSTEARAALHVALRSEDATFPERAGSAPPCTSLTKPRMLSSAARNNRRRKHRYRRLGSRAPDARAGDAQVPQGHPEAAFRFQHRPGRPRGRTRRSDPGDDLLH